MVRSHFTEDGTVWLFRYDCNLITCKFVSFVENLKIKSDGLRVTRFVFASTENWFYVRLERFSDLQIINIRTINVTRCGVFVVNIDKSILQQQHV